jgi:hypothetical protein
MLEYGNVVQRDEADLLDMQNICAIMLSCLVMGFPAA